ncbi:vacuolar transporter chaperone [Steccherinum ochraceum]|uniref:Vacuolar transporter chaperone complex subunit 4 n=1 Tax=Steccherinum ochraceum TaxID=92696 RepID=A0A4R0RMY4_9APHY|nr:vacuolar transporter chaperone [Steccherinum ochraceum]
MKFGQKISHDLYYEWRPYYIDYHLLKRELSERITAHTWCDQDEKQFTALLEKELDKIHDFQKSKTSELSHRIKEAEKSVKRLITEEYYVEEETNRSSSAQGKSQNTDYERQQRLQVVQDDTSDDDEGSIQSVDALEDLFLALEEEVANLVADIHDLALYSKLNITGFIKILKKHDEHTGRPLKPTFVAEYLEKRPFYRYNWDDLIIKISKLYDLVRTRGHEVQGDSNAGGSQNVFVRQTSKYWVHPDNLVQLKLAIMRHLPVLVFNPNKEFELKDNAITSIYLDNEDLDLYGDRLGRVEGAEAIRLRWYGDVDAKTIFVERKTHHEDWTRERSVKERFPIKEHLVNAFLRGEYIMDHEFQELARKGLKTQEEVESMIQLANEVQYAILTKGLQPIMRTSYNRIAFQLPGDARVRISLDTELAMVREDNWDGRLRSGDNWRRTDIGIDYPFYQLLPEDKELFKYGVMEVKLQTQLGQKPPQWLIDVVSSHLVEAVPKFSKFIHGCAFLVPDRVDLLPYWAHQMDVCILKPDFGNLESISIERPFQASFKESSPSIIIQRPLDASSEEHGFSEPSGVLEINTATVQEIEIRSRIYRQWSNNSNTKASYPADSDMSDDAGSSNGAIIGFSRFNLSDLVSGRPLSQDDAQVAIDAVWALLDLGQSDVRKPPNHWLRELAVKIALDHNVLPSSFLLLNTVTNGRIGDYIQKLLYEDRKLDGPAFPAAVNEWLRQIALGIQYLHSEHIIHGDLHGSNILVDSDGCIRVTDFGMSVTSDGTPYQYGSTHGGGAIRWAAPELVDAEECGLVNRRPTFQSDIYSYGSQSNIVHYIALRRYTLAKPPSRIWYKAIKSCGL